MIVSTPLRRSGIYAAILVQQGYVNAGAADALKQTPMYQLYSATAPRVEDWRRLLDKVGTYMKKDFD